MMSWFSPVVVGGSRKEGEIKVCGGDCSGSGGGRTDLVRFDGEDNPQICFILYLCIYVCVCIIFCE